jgi:hypothetical protein
MRNIIHSAVIATAILCTTAAFAANRAVVNIPFSFENNGHSYPAGQYVATLDTVHNVLVLSSETDTRVSAHWTVGPADSNPNDEKLTLTFDDLGNRHDLRTVQLGPRITSRLDTPSRHSGETLMARVGGQ